MLESFLSVYEFNVFFESYICIYWSLVSLLELRFPLWVGCNSGSPFFSSSYTISLPLLITICTRKSHAPAGSHLERFTTHIDRLLSLMLISTAWHNSDGHLHLLHTHHTKLIKSIANPPPSSVYPLQAQGTTICQQANLFSDTQLFCSTVPCLHL